VKLTIVDVFNQIQSSTWPRALYSEAIR